MPDATQHSTLKTKNFTLLFLLAAFAVLLVGAGARYMRPDEHIAYDGTQNDLLATLQFQARDVHAPLYFVLFWGWQQVVGDGELAGRVLSILCAMLTLALLARLGRRWFGGWSGPAAEVALALSSYFFVYAVEIRPYALVMLVAVLSMDRFARWLARGTRRDALLYGLTVALMLYLHYLGAFLILLQGLYFLFRWRETRVRWRQGAAALGVACLLWLPWLPVFVGQVRHVGAMAEGTRIAGLGMAGTTLPTDWPTVERFLALASNGHPVLLTLILLGGAAWLRGRRRYGLALAWGIGVPLVVFLVNLVVPVYEPRYVVHFLPGLALLVGASLVALPGRWKIAATAAFAAFGLLTVASAVPDRVPLRDYLRQLEAAFRPGDAVYLYHVRLDGLAYYQVRHYAPSILGHLYVPGYAQGIENVAEVLTDDAQWPRRVWFVTEDWFNPDVRARFEEMAAVRPLQQVIGDERYLFQLLSAPPEVEPVRFGGAMRFLGADVEVVTAERIALRLWWDVLRQPQANYSIGVYLLDGGGALVIQRDGPINNWGQEVLQTSALRPGVYYIDHRALELPPSLPPGQYRLALAVYQPWDGTRLPLAGAADDLLVLDTITLP